MGSRRLSGFFQLAWLLRGMLSRNDLPAARRASRDRNTGSPLAGAALSERLVADFALA
jgi:hypothetical protein